MNKCAPSVSMRNRIACFSPFARSHASSDSNISSAKAFAWVIRRASFRSGSSGKVCSAGRVRPRGTFSTAFLDCFFFGRLRARSFAPLKAMSRFLGCFFFAIISLACPCRTIHDARLPGTRRPRDHPARHAGWKDELSERPPGSREGPAAGRLPAFHLHEADRRGAHRPKVSPELVAFHGYTDTTRLPNPPHDFHVPHLIALSLKPSACLCLVVRALRNVATRHTDSMCSRLALQRHQQRHPALRRDVNCQRPPPRERAEALRAVNHDRLRHRGDAVGAARVDVGHRELVTAECESLTLPERHGTNSSGWRGI